MSLRQQETVVTYVCHSQSACLSRLRLQGSKKQYQLIVTIILPIAHSNIHLWLIVAIFVPSSKQ
eukprot:2217635-Ditylum_brightwellii.AAC.1